jgi:hypothetical protein
LRLGRADGVALWICGGFVYMEAVDNSNAPDVTRTHKATWHRFGQALALCLTRADWLETLHSD